MGITSWFTPTLTTVQWGVLAIHNNTKSVSSFS
jgi:hypothetical protein